MTEQEQRAAVVAEARSWLGTRYQHMQRVRGVATDCAGLPLDVYEAAGVIPHTDVGQYSRQWHLHRSEEIYLEWVRKFGREIDPSLAQPGDFIVMQFGRTYSHGAICIGMPEIIHAYIRAERVLVDDIERNAQLSGRPRKVFTFWGGA